MYYNLKDAMDVKKISFQQIANLLECRMETVSDKANGRVKCGFSIDEAIRIKNVFFGEYNLEWLFKRDVQQKIA